MIALYIYFLFLSIILYNPIYRHIYSTPAATLVHFDATVIGINDVHQVLLQLQHHTTVDATLEAVLRHQLRLSAPYWLLQLLLIKGILLSTNIDI